jgi:hypothetical protein
MDISNQPFHLIGRPTRLYMDTNQSPVAIVIDFRRDIEQALPNSTICPENFPRLE